ncbi:MAG: Cupin 2 conserved barrel domain protein [Cyanobacteria bacterium RYN_339]|nr:Cupin 2 conserved barrel domain protein [Cyanobacteria bacterium RYN_339]
MTIHVGMLEINFIATPEQTRGALSIFEVVIPPGAKSPPTHFHDVEEVVYGIEGVLTFMVDGVAHEIRAGEGLVVPANAVHRFDNLHAEPCKVLSVQTPGTIGPDFYREVGVAVSAGPPDPAKMVAIMASHGLTAVPPKA